MSYIHRNIEKKLKEYTKKYEAILVTGPRQAGKTTLLEHVAYDLFGDKVKSIAFDTASEIDMFRRDPNLFFLNNPGILLLDEIQHVPDIFPYLKREIDKNRGIFRFFITGSQNFSLMKNVSESLSGRIAVLDLWPFVRREIEQKDISSIIDLFAGISDIGPLLGKEYTVNDYEHVCPFMLNGGYPPVAVENKGLEWFEFYRKTYLQRDVRDLAQVGDIGKFDRFLMLVAGRSGNIINKAEISRSLSIDNKTVDNWFSILVTSYQAVSLPAYFKNMTKRIVKHPKWIFSDSGLCLHLQGIRNNDSLLASPHFGSLFESFVIMELWKIFAYTTTVWNAFYFRTSNGVECDLIFDIGDKLIPIEIKHTAQISNISLAGLETFITSYPQKASQGFIISLYQKFERLSDTIINIPLGYIL